MDRAVREEAARLGLPPAASSEREDRRPGPEARDGGTAGEPPLRLVDALGRGAHSPSEKRSASRRSGSRPHRGRSEISSKGAGGSEGPGSPRGAGRGDPSDAKEKHRKKRKKHRAGKAAQENKDWHERAKALGNAKRERRREERADAGHQQQAKRSKRG